MASRPSDLGPGGRVVAACLAAIWLALGLASVCIGLWLRPGVLPTVLGLLAVGYGVLWLRVAVTGERQRWPRGRRKPGGRGGPRS